MPSSAVPRSAGSHERRAEDQRSRYSLRARIGDGASIGSVSNCAKLFEQADFGRLELPLAPDSIEALFQPNRCVLFVLEARCGAVDRHMAQVKSAWDVTAKRIVA